MKELIRQIFIKTHLLEVATKQYKNLVLRKRRRPGVNHSIIERYFSEHEERKLHLGCGRNMIDGWLNSDFIPLRDDVLFLDVTNRFPFENDTFDYIFCEHMIEHISYADGFTMLSECQRVLKNNGKIRISTPDLEFLIDMYQDNKSELQLDYMKWSTENYINHAPYPSDTFVINNFVRNWGHLFIYDEKTLRSSFERAGFGNILRRKLNESEYEALQDLENEERMPSGFLQLESFTMEGAKKDATIK